MVPWAGDSKVWTKHEDKLRPEMPWGVIVNEIGMRPMITQFQQEYIWPIASGRKTKQMGGRHEIKMGANRGKTGKTSCGCGNYDKLGSGESSSAHHPFGEHRMNMDEQRFFSIYLL